MGTVPWSVQFDDVDFAEFLFASGDCENWLITHRDQVPGASAGAEKDSAKKEDKGKKNKAEVEQSNKAETSAFSIDALNESLKRLNSM